MQLRLYAAALLLVGAGMARAQDPMELLAQARARITASMKRLPRYTCVETVERKYYRLVPTGRGPTTPRPCPQILFNKNSGKSMMRLVMTDRLRLDVAVSASGEIYSWVGASQFDSRPLAEMVGGGVVSTGAFGTYLVDIFENLGATFHFLRRNSSSGRAHLEYSYRVPPAASHYQVGIPGAAQAGMLGSWHVTGHEGSFSIDAETLDLVHLNIRSDILPPVTEMCQATTTLEYQRLTIGEQDFLLPRTSALETVATDAHETQTMTTFSNCRQYGAESTLQFEETAGDAGGAGKSAVSGPIAIPAWLPATLAFAAPLNTDTIAKGDAIRATLSEPIRRADSKEVLIPAGATVIGRITKMEHQELPSSVFLIGLAFDAIESRGVTSPVRLSLDATRQSRRQLELTTELDPSDSGTTLAFLGKEHLVIPAGYKTNWMTAKPAAKR